MSSYEQPSHWVAAIPEKGSSQLDIKVHFKNAPKLSEYEADQKFNERRLRLISEVKYLITTTELFKDKELSVEFAHTGVSSLICFVESGTKDYVLKVPLSLSDGGDSEAEFLNRWEATGVRVPHVFESGRLGDHAYTIMEYIDAPVLSAAIEQGLVNEDTVYGDMGRMLATMHTPTADGYGRIIRGKPHYRTFKDWLVSEDIKKRIRAVQERNLLGKEHGPLPQVFDNLLAYAEKETGSSYCHFDFTAPNVFATNPLTVFDPSPMLNHGVIDIGRSMLATVLERQPDAGDQMKEAYFATGRRYDPKALQASLVLNAYWKFPYAHKKKRTEAMENVRQYLIATRHLL